MGSFKVEHRTDFPFKELCKESLQQFSFLCGKGCGLEGHDLVWFHIDKGREIPNFGNLIRFGTTNYFKEFTHPFPILCAEEYLKFCIIDELI